MSLEHCGTCGALWTAHTTGGCPAPHKEMDEAALDAAERAYWGDAGVSRHNLAAAIRAYLNVVRGVPTGESGAGESGGKP